MPHPRQTFIVRKPAEKFLKALSHEMDLAFEDMHGHSVRHETVPLQEGRPASLHWPESGTIG